MGCQRSDPQAVEPLPWLLEVAAGLGVALDADKLGAFAAFQELLIEQGTQFNLTTVLDPEGIQRRHFGESLAVGAALQDAGLLHGEERLIDVGSGAGFPGLPLAIAWPELQVTLLEATRKKAAFLERVVRELRLPRVQVVAARAEEAAHRHEHRERFDLATARAVARLPALAELLLPFVRVGGHAAAVKGSRMHEELREAGAAIRRCGGGHPQMLPLQAGESALHLVVIGKERTTPRTLPRRSGLPVHDPLR